MRVGPNFRESHALRDGTRVVLRPIRPSDRGELVRVFHALSPHSRYLRFFSAGGSLDDAQLRYLTEVDGVGHVAIVAIVESLDLKTERGVGVARFVRLPDEPLVAEAAVTVADDMQGKGLGTLMLTVLAQAAWERGVRAFRGEVLAENAVMRGLLEQAGARTSKLDDATLVYDVPLGEPPHDPSERASPLRRVLRAAAESMAAIVRKLAPPG